MSVIETHFLHVIFFFPFVENLDMERFLFAFVNWSLERLDHVINMLFSFALFPFHLALIMSCPEGSQLVHHRSTHHSDGVVVVMATRLKDG